MLSPYHSFIAASHERDLSVRWRERERKYTRPCVTERRNRYTFHILKPSSIMGTTRALSSVCHSFSKCIRYAERARSHAIAYRRSVSHSSSWWSSSAAAVAGVAAATTTTPGVARNVMVIGARIILCIPGWFRVTAEISQLVQQQRRRAACVRVLGMRARPAFQFNTRQYQLIANEWIC